MRAVGVKKFPLIVVASLIFTAGIALKVHALSNEISYPLPGVSEWPFLVQFSPDGTHLATANQSDISLFDVATATLTGGTSYLLPPGPAQPWSVAFLPGGSYLATANPDSNDIALFRVETGGTLVEQAAYLLPQGSTGPQDLAFSPNGFYLATANYSNVKLDRIFRRYEEVLSLSISIM